MPRMQQNTRRRLASCFVALLVSIQLLLRTSNRRDPSANNISVVAAYGWRASHCRLGRERRGQLVLAALGNLAATKDDDDSISAAYTSEEIVATDVRQRNTTDSNFSHVAMPILGDSADSSISGLLSSNREERRDQGEERKPSADGTASPDSLAKLSQQMRSILKIVLHQQRQLDELQDALRALALPPATLFVDGTWLYYSLFERSSISSHFRIPHWHYHYHVDWKAVLKLLNRQFNVNIKEQYVFTSAKADTATNSPRYMLFESLREAGFNVDMMETVGPGEKCVDIKLATQMIAQDFEIGIILTGDKDFLPALTLCRQKQGKKIGLFSMREGCNRALSELDNVRDFDVVWLEDHIKEIFVSKTSADGEQNAIQQFSDADFGALEFIYKKVTYDFILESGVGVAHARDLGRHMKKVPLLDTTVLDYIKSFRGSLTAFVTTNDAFVVDYSSQDRDTWTVSWNKKNLPPNFERASGSTSDILHKFREYYTDQFVQSVTRNKAFAYEFTFETLRERGVPIPVAAPNVMYDESMKKEDLQKAAEDLGLSKWGTKAELVARLTGHQVVASTALDNVNSPEHNYLAGLIIGFLKSLTGRAGSRAVGRYLSSCKPFDAFHPSALSELKALYGNLYEFITRSNAQLEADFDYGDSTEFLVIFSGPMTGSGDALPQGTQAKLTFDHLKDLLSTYLISNGGTMGSRDIGRYLAGCEAHNNKFGDALAELKSTYGNLMAFIELSEGHFKNHGVLKGKEFAVSVETESSVVS